VADSITVLYLLIYSIMPIKIRYDAQKGLIQERVRSLSDAFVDLPSLGIPKQTTSGSAPSASNDTTQGYTVGSRWVDTAADDEYVCVDATASAAVWKSTTSGSAGVGGSGGGADPGASYVVMGATGSLANERVLTAGSGLRLTDAGAGSTATFAINDGIVATVSGTIFTGAVVGQAGFSGSLTRLSDGTSYLRAGSNVTISSSSNGAVTISATGGSSTTGGPLSQMVWVAAGTASSSVYNNGLRYVPLRNAQTDEIEFQFVCASSGSLETIIYYAMSAANAGGIRLQFDSLAVGIGDDPNTTPTLGSAFTITPGSNTTIHSASQTESSTLLLSADVGDLVYCRLTRSGSDAADTHTGDLRLIEIRVRQNV